MHTMHACMCARLNGQSLAVFKRTLYPHRRVVYRMHEVNNAAKDASLSVYFQPGMSRTRPTWSINTDGVSS